MTASTEGQPESLARLLRDLHIDLAEGGRGRQQRPAAGAPRGWGPKVVAGALRSPSLIQRLYIVGSKQQRRQLMAAASDVRRAQIAGDAMAQETSMKALLLRLPVIFEDNALRHRSLHRELRAASAKFARRRPRRELGAVTLRAS